MTELEAINILIRAAGNTPVNSVESSLPDAIDARALLTRVKRKEQKNDWWFNVDYNVTYPLDENKRIKLPKQVLSVEVRYQDGIVKRGSYLYNTFDNTYQFDAEVTAWKVIRNLDWDDMPEAMQELVAYKAAAEFVRDELEDYQKADEFKEEGMKALADLTDQHLREGDFNMFTSTRVRQARQGVRPYRGNQGVRFT